MQYEVRSSDELKEDEMEIVQNSYLGMRTSVFSSDIYQNCFDCIECPFEIRSHLGIYSISKHKKKKFKGSQTQKINGEQLKLLNVVLNA